jgi:hypothetical protein
VFFELNAGDLGDATVEGCAGIVERCGDSENRQRAER